MAEEVNVNSNGADNAFKSKLQYWRRMSDASMPSSSSADNLGTPKSLAESAPSEVQSPSLVATEPSPISEAPEVTSEPTTLTLDTKEVDSSIALPVERPDQTVTTTMTQSDKGSKEKPKNDASAPPSPAVSTPISRSVESQLSLLDEISAVSTTRSAVLAPAKGAKGGRVKARSGSKTGTKNRSQRLMKRATTSSKSPKPRKREYVVEDWKTEKVVSRYAMPTKSSLRRTKERVQKTRRRSRTIGASSRSREKDSDLDSDSDTAPQPLSAGTSSRSASNLRGTLPSRRSRNTSAARRGRGSNAQSDGEDDPRPLSMVVGSQSSTNLKGRTKRTAASGNNRRGRDKQRSATLDYDEWKKSENSKPPARKGRQRANNTTLPARSRAATTKTTSNARKMHGKGKPKRSTAKAGSNNDDHDPVSLAEELDDTQSRLAAKLADLEARFNSSSV